MATGKPMLIAVDTGNHSIKTPNFVFRASYSEYDGSLGGDCLVYGGKSYSICDKRLPHEDNKANEGYRILTMVAMAKELLYRYEKRELEVPEPVSQNVALCLGLPPRHLSRYREEYVSFYKGEYHFSYAGHVFDVTVTDVLVFSQCLAAAQSQMGSILGKGNNIYLVDIGGYTTDILNLIKEGGVPRLNPDCQRTMNKGVLRMYGSIINRVEEDYDYAIPVVDLDRYFMEPKRAVQLKDPLHEVFDSTCRAYVFSLLDGYVEEGIMLTSAVPVFLGGGSQIFLPYIREYFAAKPHRFDPVFITDVRANAEGYLKMGREQMAARKSR